MNAPQLKFTVHIQSGFECKTCSMMTVVEGHELPDECGNCGGVEFRLKWKQKIKTQTTIEHLPVP